MRTSILVRFSFEGIHSWPNAPAGPQEYLLYPHRHMFHVEAVRDVEHEERHIEIIAFKHELQTFCQHHMSLPHHMSCETMARTLLERFELRRCQVLEDNENGAEVSVD